MGASCERSPMWSQLSPFRKPATIRLMLSSKTGIAPACNVLNGERMFRQRLRSFFEKTPAIHYIKQHETVVIGEIVVDVKNIMLRPYACDGAHCLSTRSLPNHLEDYGFTFY